MVKLMAMSHRNKICLFLLFAFTIFLLLPSLNDSIRRSDEGIYANVTHEMLVNQNPFAPTFYNQPYYNKLPLRFWISYSLNSIIGEHNFSYRIPEVLFTLALILLIVLYGKSFFNKYSVGLLAGVLFITSECYLNIAKQFTTNNLTLLLNVWVMGLLWSWYKSFKENSSTKFSTILLISILSGLTFFTRTVYAFIPPLIFFCFLHFKLKLLNFIKKEEIKITYTILIFVGTVYLLFLPLVFYNDLTNLFNAILVKEVYERATTGYHNINNYFFYIEKLLSPHYSIAPVLLISSLLYTAYKSLRKNDLHLYLFLWAVVPVILFSIPKSHLTWYILISFPAFALIGANFIISIFSAIFTTKNLGIKIILSIITLYCGYICYSQVSHSISQTYTGRKRAIDVLTSKIKNDQNELLNPIPLAIEAEIQQRFDSNKADRYYINLITDKSIFLTSSEIIKAIENNSYDFYMTSFELFEKINKRFHPKGIILNYARRTFFQKTAIFSFKYDSEFSPFMDNKYRQLEFSYQNDKSYKIKNLSNNKNNTYLVMTFDNYCKDPRAYYLKIKEPAKKLRIRYFLNNKAYIATIIDKANYHEEIIVKPEESCLKLINVSDGIDINKMLTNKPYNQAVNSAH